MAGTKIFFNINCSCNSLSYRAFKTFMNQVFPLTLYKQAYIPTTSVSKMSITSKNFSHLDQFSVI